MRQPFERGIDVIGNGHIGAGQGERLTLKPSSSAHAEDLGLRDWRCAAKPERKAWQALHHPGARSRNLFCRGRIRIVVICVRHGRIWGSETAALLATALLTARVRRKINDIRRRIGMQE